MGMYLWESIYWKRIVKRNVLSHKIVFKYN